MWRAHTVSINSGGDANTEGELTMTNQTTTTPDRLILICGNCDGNGCSHCHGDGEYPEPMVRCITCWTMVPESYIADTEAQFCRDCEAAGNDEAPDPPAAYTPTADDLAWAMTRAEAQRVNDPVIRKLRAAQIAATMRRPWVEEI